MRIQYSRGRKSSEFQNFDFFFTPNNTTLIIKTQTSNEYSHQVLRVVATAYFSEESDVWFASLR